MSLNTIFNASFSINNQINPRVSTDLTFPCQNILEIAYIKKKNPADSLCAVLCC